MRWDPERYLGYADERGRPFWELLARVARRDVGRHPGVVRATPAEVPEQLGFAGTAHPP